MNQKQAGFTLIELVIVIVVLGILAVVAVPKYIDIVGDARQAATAGVAGNLGSASGTNFAVRNGFSTKGVSIGDCTDVSNAMAGGLPTGYTISSLGVTNGATASCTLTGGGSTTANFVAHGIS